MIFFVAASAGLGSGDVFAETSTVKGIVNSILALDDRTPPEIELEGISDNETVYTDKIYIAGQAFDNKRIESITINEAPLIINPGRSIYFSYLADLHKGENIISIEACDEEGIEVKKDIVVTREDAPHSNLPKEVFDRRMRLAVYPFEQKGTVSAESSMFMDMLLLALEREARFQLTDRSLMDRVLSEQKLSLTQLADQEAALKAGRIMSAQAIVTGSIIKTGEGIEMIGRMIDTETSGIMVTEKLYFAEEGTSALKFLAQSLAVKFHNDFPMLGGIVVARQGGGYFYQSR